MVTQGILLDSSDSEYSFDSDYGSLWEQEDENDGASSVASSPYEVSKWEAYLYYHGIRGPRRMGPKLVFRTSTDKFTAPLIPGQDPRLMQLLPPSNHAILSKNDLWDTISAQVVHLLDQREIKYSSIDLVRFCWAEKIEDNKGGDDDNSEGNEDSDGDEVNKGGDNDKEFDINTMLGPHEEIITTPNTIWVGVLPDTLTGEVASRSSEDILALLKKHGISDVDVAYRESVVMDFKGPKLFAPVSELNPLVTVIDPVTTALGLPIAGLKTLHNEGTMGFYFRAGDDYYAVTARHILFPEHEGNQEYRHAGHKKEVVLMGAQAFSNLLISIQNRIGDLGDTVKVLQGRIKTLTRRLQGDGSEDKEAEEGLQMYQGELARTERAIPELKKFFQEISKGWSRPKDRVIGYVIWAPPITYSTPPHGHTVDVCIIKLDKEKFLGNFKGNVLDLGLEFDEKKLNRLMYPRVDYPPYFEYPEGRLLKFSGILSAEELRKANDNDKELNNGPATFVMKHGLATQTTIGRLSGFKSRVRRYFIAGAKDSLEVAVSPYDSQLSPFSKAGDSGSIIVDAGGKFVALLTAGKGVTDASDITYGSPICWLWDLIKPKFPGASLYF